MYRIVEKLMDWGADPMCNDLVGNASTIHCKSLNILRDVSLREHIVFNIQDKVVKVKFRKDRGMFEMQSQENHCKVVKSIGLNKLSICRFQMGWDWVSGGVSLPF